MSRMDPIERFLALTPAERTPLALLNITTQQCDIDSIQEALQRRLDRIDRHPEGSTPEADSVRMALHAAAAQLNDPSVRSRILGDGSDNPEAPAPAPSATPAPAPASTTNRQAQIQAMLTFRRTAIRTILLCGGWNKRSRRMLSAVAWFSGLEPGQMSIALRSLSGPLDPSSNGAPRQSATAAPSAPKPAPQQTPIFESFHEKPAGASAVSSNVILGFSGAFAAVVIMLIITVRLLSPGAGSPDPVASAPDSSTPNQPRATPPSSEAPSQPAQRRSPLAADVDPADASAPKPILNPPDPAGLVRTLRRCVELAKTDPGDAAWRFEQAISQLSGAWAMLEPATLEAAHDAIRVFLLDAPAGSERSTRALNAVSAGARKQASAEPLSAYEVWPAVWSSGILAELYASPGGAAPVREYVLSVLSAVSGATGDSPPDGFVEGAFTSLGQMTPTLSSFDSGRDAVAAWGRWREALDTTTALMAHESNEFDATNQREITTLDAIETLMRTG